MHNFSNLKSLEQKCEGSNSVLHEKLFYLESNKKKKKK